MTAANSGGLLRRALQKLPPSLVLRLVRAVLPRYVRALPPRDGLRFLLAVMSNLDAAGEEQAYEVAGGLNVQHWWSQNYHFFVRHLSKECRVAHLGCKDGSLSYVLVSLTPATVVAADIDHEAIDKARQHYRHPRLSFVAGEAMAGQLAADVIVFTDIDRGLPMWRRWTDCWRRHGHKTVLAQLTEGPWNWRVLRQEDVCRNESTPELSDKTLPEGWELVEASREWGMQFAVIRAR